MNWVDLLVLALAILAAVSGSRQGMITALFSFAGVIAGAVIGVQLAPLLVAQFSSPVARISFGVGIVVFLVAMGETFGVWLGHEIKSKINMTRLTGVDNALGAVVQGLAVFVVAWLVAIPLTSAAGFTGLASAVNNSTVLGLVHRAMPAEAQKLPEELKQLLNVSGFPDALAPFTTAPKASVPPGPEVADSPIPARVRPSIVKVRGQALSCSRALEGTGFVVAPHRVMTNAHVVAGTNKTAVEVGRGLVDATVVLFDPNTDVAVLDVPELSAPPLTFDLGPAQTGQDGMVIGYPLDGPYRAVGARVREKINLNGPNIYDSETVRRDVYTVRAVVQSGNSGGPLLDPQGHVLGVVFGAAVDDSETGFVLTAHQVEPALDAAPGLTQEVSTGQCTKG